MSKFMREKGRDRREIRGDEEEEIEAVRDGESMDIERTRGRLGGRGRKREGGG